MTTGNFFGRLAALGMAAFGFTAGAPADAAAQSFSSQPSTSSLATNPGALGGAPGAALAPPSGTLGPATPAPFAAPMALQPIPNIPAGQVALVVSARYGRDLPSITAGLVWRVYAGKPDQNGALRILKEEKSASPTFALPPGSYLVHAGFGMAGTVKPVQLRPGEPIRETFDIPAGGLTLRGQVGDVRIPAGQISFDVYQGSQFDIGDKRPLVQSVMSGDVVLLSEGTYNIVSNYGDANSVVRSDIRVQTGKLTDVTVTHRAAVILLKLVTDKGGEALANTAWSVITPGGDVIKESIGAFPRVVLAEGEYRALARNEGKVYERQFKVITGVDGEVEVLAR